MTIKQNVPLINLDSDRQEVEGKQAPSCSATPQANTHGSNLLRFRGLLLRRRCDFCGTRISICDECTDKVIMKCPDCRREYVFFERPE